MTAEKAIKDVSLKFYRTHQAYEQQGQGGLSKDVLSGQKGALRSAHEDKGSGQDYDARALLYPYVDLGRKR